MRSRFLFSILITASLSATAQPTTTIGGTIADTTGFDVMNQICIFPLDQIEGGCPFMLAGVNGNQFRVQAELDKPFYARYIHRGKFVKGVYLMPGDNVQLNINTGELKGSNTSLLKFFNKLEPYFKNFETEMTDTAIFKLDRVAFIAAAREKRDKQLRYVIEHFVGLPPLSQDMRKLLESDINYSYALKLTRYAHSAGKDKRFAFRYNDFMEALLEVPTNDPEALSSPAYVQYLYELPFRRWQAEINWGMTDKPPYNKMVANEFPIRDSLAKKFFSGANYELALYGILLDAVRDAAKVKGTPEFEAAYEKSEGIINKLGKNFTNGILNSRIKERLAELKEPERVEPVKAKPKGRKKK